MLAALTAVAILSPQLGWRAGTPTPILVGNPKWVELYWKAWENLYAATVEEHEPGPWPPRVFAAGGKIDFDKILAITLYARWGWRAHPVVDSLSYVLGNVKGEGNVASLFERDTSSGEARGLPIAALAVARLLNITGDKTALLVQAAGAQRRSHYFSTSYSYTIEPTDEKEKPRVGYRVPAEFSALPFPAEPPGEISAEAVGLLLQDTAMMAQLARSLGDRRSATTWDRIAGRYADMLAKLWNDKERRYTGASEAGPERDSLMPLLSAIGGKAPQAKHALAGLFNPQRYYRRALFPTLPKGDAAYNGGGATRPLHSYLALRALLENDMHKDAGRAAESMMSVYESCAGSSLDLFDFYGPETRTPPEGSLSGSLEAGTIVIAGLIEAVIGIDVDALKDKVTWYVRRTDKHGLENLRFGDNVVSLIWDAGAISVDCKEPFTLEVTQGTAKQTKRFSAGKSVWQLDGKG